jgi:hypothetical protein
MILRPELNPPSLDPARVARLAELADWIDGARPGEWEAELAEFQALSGVAVPFEDFQGIYGGMDHAEWVRRLLYRQVTPRLDDLTLEEMIEIVSRLMPQNGHPDSEFYLQLFLANSKHPGGTDLIFWPNLVPELAQDREPTAEEIADLALKGVA